MSAATPLPRATAVIPRGSGALPPVDRVALDQDSRHRRRIAMRGEKGLAFLLDLPEARALRDGDGLVLDDGRVVEVRALPEPLLDVRGRDAPHLARLAWHLGNRHVAAAIEAERILIRRDPVLADMLARLGASIVPIEAAFEPEKGAYAHSHGHDAR